MLMAQNRGRNGQQVRDPALQYDFFLGGLGEIGGAAEVAPVVVVGAEGEGFFAVGGKSEVGVDDGEDAFFGEHGQ